MTGAAVPPSAAVPDFVYELEPLDWLVIAAAAICGVVLFNEWRRGRATPVTGE